MKRIFLFISIAVLSFSMLSCDLMNSLFNGVTEAEAVEVAQALVSPVSNTGSSVSPSLSRGLSRDLSRDLSIFPYTEEQPGGGTAVISYTADTNSTDFTVLMNGTLKIVYDNFIAEITNEDGEEKSYTITGTIFYDTVADVDWTLTSLTYSYDIDMYTEDPVAVTGEGVDTDINLDITETLDVTFEYTNSTYSYTVAYDCSGTVNNVQIDDESGTFTYSYTE